MELLNATKMVTGYTQGMLADGRELLVVVIKGTFDLPKNRENARLSAVQLPLVEADTFTGEPGFSAPLYESDYAPVKPYCDVILTSIICDKEGEIFACGQKGVILRGTKDSLRPLNLEGITDDFWSIAKFRGEVYVSSTTALYKLVDDETLELVKYSGEEIPTSFYHLDTYEDSHMLSVGQKDAVLFDGEEWVRIL
jgi:hypothetical protein